MDTTMLRSDAARGWSFAGGLVVTSQAWSWTLIASPTGSVLAVDPLALVVLLGAFALGAGGPGAQRPVWARVAAVLPSLAGGASLLLAPWAVSPARPAWGIAAATLLVLFPAGWFAGGVARRAPAWFLGGAAALLVLLGLAAGALPHALLLAGAPLVLLPVAIFPGVWSPGERSLSGPGLRALHAVVALAAAALSFALVAWTGSLPGLLGTGAAELRALLLAIVLGLLAGTLAGRRIPPGWAALGPILAGAWSLLAATALLPLMRLGVASGIDPAWGVGMFVLLPLAAAAAAGIHRLVDEAPSPGREVALGAGAAAGVVGAVLLAGPLGSGGLLRLAAIALPLIGALPGLAVIRFAPPAVRGLLAAVGLLLVVATLWLSPVKEKLFLADLARFAPADAAGIPDHLGRTRVLETRRTAGALEARRQRDGSAVETVWAGGSLASDDALDRACRATSGLIAAVVHRDPQRVLLLYRSGDAAAAALADALPGAEINSTWWVEPFTGDPRDASTGARGTYDLVHSRPPPPAAATGQRAWSGAALAGMKGLLRPGGVAVLVLDPEQHTGASFTRLLATFRSSLPHVALWSDGCRLVLVGGSERLQVEHPALESRFWRVAARVVDAGLRHPGDLAGRFLMPGTALAEMSSDGRATPLLGAPALPRADSGASAVMLGPRLTLPADPTAFIAGGPLPEDFTQRARSASDAMALVLSARTHRAAADLQGALVNLQEAARRRPGDALVRRSVSDLSLEAALDHRRRGDAAGGLAWAEQAAGLQPDRLDPQLVLIDLLRLNGREEDAERQLDALSRKFSSSYPVLLLQARRMLDRGSLGAAQERLARAAETGYETAELVLGRARLAFLRGRPREGRRLVTRALDLTVDPARALTDFAGRLVTDGDPTLARTFLERAVERGGATGDRLALLGSLALARKDYPEAIRNLEEAAAMQPRRVAVWRDLGSSYLLSGDAAAALRPLDRAAELAPGDPMIRLNRAAALSRTGRVDEARVELEAIGNALAGNPVLERLRQEIGVAPVPGG